MAKSLNTNNPVVATCGTCSSSCFMCLNTGTKNCLTCFAGYQLNLINSTTGVGNCTSKTKSSTTTNYYVTGNRNVTEVSPNFSDLMSAVYATFKTANNLKNKTYNIYVNPDIDHYILLKDVSVLIELRYYLQP